MQYHRSWGNRGRDTACAYCRVADCGPPNATDHQEFVEVIQLRVNAFMMENCGLVPQIMEEIEDLITGMTGPIILRGCFREVVQTSSSTKSWIASVEFFRRFAPFFAPFRMEARAHFSALEHSHGSGGAESPGVVLLGDSAPGLPIRSYSGVDIDIAGSSICLRNNHNNHNHQPATPLSPLPSPPPTHTHPHSHPHPPAQTHHTHHTHPTHTHTTHTTFRSHFGSSRG